MYGGWRQSYFIYPAFIILSINGLSSLYNILKKLKHKKNKNIKYFLCFDYCFKSRIYSTVHDQRTPKQYVYHNILAGKNMKQVKNRFLMDYWGLSYRQALEYILKNDDGEIINIKTHGGPPDDTSGYILKEEQRNRLIFVDNIDDADYFLHNFGLGSYKQYELKNEIFNVSIGDAEIMEIYKLK